VSCIGYPVERVSTFECSDERLNAVWRDAVHTLSLCMQDRFEDDPLRGHGSSVEVARIQALANYYCFFDTLLPRQALCLFARTQDPGPTWALMLHDYHLHTADRSLVEELYPQLRRSVEEWECEPELLYHALRDAAKLASAIGEIDDTIAWHDRAEGILRTFDNAFPSDNEGACLDALQSAALSDCPDTAAVHVLPAEILGVKPSIPESGVVIIQPRVGELDWARGHIKTHRGFVDVEWRMEPGVFTIDIDAPEGFILGLPVGRFRNPAIEEIDLSPETPERRARKTYGWGSMVWRDGEEHDPYLDWLRTQEAEPPEGYESRRRCSVESNYLWIRECLIPHVRYVVREGGEREGEAPAEPGR